MKEVVLDLITSYENRISAVEEWISAAHQAAAGANSASDALDQERERLKTSLQETLAKNCSLRKKDFSRLMSDILADSDEKGREIEEERKRVIEGIKGYLEEQKTLAVSLRQQLSSPDTDTGLATVIGNLKVTHEDTGHLFTILRDFQSRMTAFRAEQEEMNRLLKRLVDRGELLRTEDVRDLKAGAARQSRKAERETRRREVASLLAHFKDYRRNPPMVAKN